MKDDMNKTINIKTNESDPYILKKKSYLDIYMESYHIWIHMACDVLPSR